MNIKKVKFLNSFSLRIIAMVAMFINHMWSTIMPDNNNLWLTCIGRIAFPIFAFLIVEGFFHTSSFKKYLLRMAIFAFVSEIPFNLMVSSKVVFPFHQNVLFTFTVGLLTLYAIEHIKKIDNNLLQVASIIFICMFSFIFNTVILADYFGYGILMILTFYFAHGIKYGWVIELLSMIYINYFLLGGISITLFNGAYELPTQAFAILSLIFIWLYNGNRGPSGKVAQYSFYIFYPLHMIILYILSIFI